MTRTAVSSDGLEMPNSISLMKAPEATERRTASRRPVAAAHLIDRHAAVVRAGHRIVFFSL